MDCSNNKDQYHHKIPKSLLYLPTEPVNCIICTQVLKMLLTNNETFSRCRFNGNRGPAEM